MEVPLVGHAGHRVRVFTTAPQAASRLAPLARVQPRTLCPAWPAATLTKAPRPACVSPSLAARMLGAALSRVAAPVRFGCRRRAGVDGKGTCSHRKHKTGSVTLRRRRSCPTFVIGSPPIRADRLGLFCSKPWKLPHQVRRRQHGVDRSTVPQLIQKREILAIEFQAAHNGHSTMSSIGELVSAVAISTHGFYNSAFGQAAQQVVRSGRAESDALCDVGGAGFTMRS